MQTQTHSIRFTADEVHKRFVTWDRGEAEREWACLRLLAEHAPGLAPRPLRFLEEDGAPVVVMERLRGRPGGDVPLTALQTTALASVLRRLHSVPLDALRAGDIGERRAGPTTEPTAVAGRLEEPHDLAACLDPSLVARAVEAASAWLARPGALPEPRLTVLGIADLNPANVLWEGLTCRLVDFEDAGLTDRAYELADHCEHLAARLQGAWDAEALLAAVGLDPGERERVEAFRCLWAVRWLVLLLPGGRAFGRNPPGTTEAQTARVLTLLGREPHARATPRAARRVEGVWSE